MNALGSVHDMKGSSSRGSSSASRTTNLWDRIGAGFHSMVEVVELQNARCCLYPKYQEAFWRPLKGQLDGGFTLSATGDV
jgi:hypothetical protein